MTSTSSRPSAFRPLFRTDASGVAFLKRHPATLDVALTAMEADGIQAELRFRDDAPAPPQEDWALPNVGVPGDRGPDLSFENTGAPPPLGFWMTHPDVGAWTTSSLEGDSDGWWVKVWLKAF